MKCRELFFRIRGLAICAILEPSFRRRGLGRGLREVGQWTSYLILVEFSAQEKNAPPGEGALATVGCSIRFEKLIRYTLTAIGLGSAPSIEFAVVYSWR